MVEIILIIFLLVSFIKPDVLLNQMIKEKATLEEKKIVVKSNRRLYLMVILGLDILGSLVRIDDDVSLVAMIIVLATMFAIILIIYFTSRGIMKQSKEIVNKYKE